MRGGRRVAFPDKAKPRTPQTHPPRFSTRVGQFVDLRQSKHTKCEQSVFYGINLCRTTLCVTYGFLEAPISLQMRNMVVQCVPFISHVLLTCVTTQLLKPWDNCTQYRSLLYKP